MNDMHVCRKALRPRAYRPLTPVDLDQATCVDGIHALARATRKQQYSARARGKRSLPSAMRFVIRTSERIFYLMLAFMGIFCWFVAGLFMFMSKNRVESISSSEFVRYGFMGMIDPLAFIIGFTITYVLWISFRTMRNNPDKFEWLAT